MLKRIGMEMTLMVIPIPCFFIFNTIFLKTSQTNLGCFLIYFSSMNSLLLLIQLFFSISGSMIFYIAVCEFIYVQNPRSMKGLEQLPNVAVLWCHLKKMQVWQWHTRCSSLQRHYKWGMDFILLPYGSEWRWTNGSWEMLYWVYY